MKEEKELEIRNRVEESELNMWEGEARRKEASVVIETTDQVREQNWKTLFYSDGPVEFLLGGVLSMNNIIMQRSDVRKSLYGPN